LITLHNNNNNNNTRQYIKNSQRYCFQVEKFQVEF